MKLIIRAAAIFTICFSGVLAFAGPEDHKEAQVCYRLSADQIATKGTHVPFEICVEEIGVDVSKSTVSVYSYFQGDLFQNLKTDSLVRQTEDTYRFHVSSALFAEDEYVCGPGVSVTLRIQGDSDFLGTVQKDQLKVTVDEDQTRDSCHSYPETKVYTYSL